jgi:hypothetical protein
MVRHQKAPPNERVTLACGCAGILTWRVPDVAACGVVITSLRDGCDEHVAGGRKLISKASIVARRAVWKPGGFVRRRPRPLHP